MKRSRFNEEQIIGILKEHQAGLGAKELCRKHGISDATFYKWRSKYSGMEVSDARRLKALEAENAKLVATHPDGVPRVAKALLGSAVLGTRIFLNHLGQCDRRHHHAVPGITFRQMMPPASAGVPFTSCSPSFDDWSDI